MKRLQESLDWKGDRLDVDFTFFDEEGIIELDYVWSHNENRDIKFDLFASGEIDALEGDLFSLI